MVPANYLKILGKKKGSQSSNELQQGGQPTNSSHSSALSSSSNSSQSQFTPHQTDLPSNSTSTNQQSASYNLQPQTDAAIIKEFESALSTDTENNMNTAFEKDNYGDNDYQQNQEAADILSKVDNS